MSFEEMNLFAPLQRALTEQKYKRPTPIQAQTIPHAIEGLDILGCAQTGTGKTAAFALPILDHIGHEQLRAKSKRPIALVLSPTRELARQISDSFDVYGKYVNCRQALAYGGVSQNSQVTSLRQGTEVLVATPGRLLDLMDQRHVDLGDIEIFVLDEADRMLDMGFLPALKRIASSLPSERQSLFFSATMPTRIRNLAEKLLFNPVSVTVAPLSRNDAGRICESVRFLDRADKLFSLRSVLSEKSVDRAIVFTRTKHGANALAKKLGKVGIHSATIHGNKTQNARQNALEAFRRKEVTVLVATDVAARGIDIHGVTHVINFDMPVDPESYVHRIGRTGRAGADGIAISFCTAEEIEELNSIEKLTRRKLTPENPEARFKANTPTVRKAHKSGNARRTRNMQPARRGRGSKSPKTRVPRNSTAI